MFTVIFWGVLTRIYINIVFPGWLTFVSVIWTAHSLLCFSEPTTVHSITDLLSEFSNLLFPSHLHRPNSCYKNVKPLLSTHSSLHESRLHYQNTKFTQFHPLNQLLYILLLLTSHYNIHGQIKYQLDIYTQIFKLVPTDIISSVRWMWIIRFIYFDSKCMHLSKLVHTLSHSSS